MSVLIDVALKQRRWRVTSTFNCKDAATFFTFYYAHYTLSLSHAGMLRERERDSRLPEMSCLPPGGE
jgi:hypothetical protein